MVFVIAIINFVHRIYGDFFWNASWKNIEWIPLKIL